MILEILIPVIWLLGLLGVANLLAKSNRIRPELFFPAAGFSGLAIYGLGLMGWLYQCIFIGVTSFFLLASVWLIVKSRAISIVFEAVKKHPLNAAAAIIVMAFLGIAALSYPVNTDALYFHLGLSKLYARGGAVFFTPDNLFSASPRTSEMIITAFYSLGLERAGQFFVLLIAAVFIWAVASRARDFKASGLYAILIILTVPIFVSQITCSKNDILLWGLSFYAILKFWEFARDGKSRDLIWAGIGVGMAAGTKAIGLALYGALALLMIYNVALGRYRYREFALFSLAFFIFCCPWYIYSWVVTGNPVFPFFDTVFSSPYTPQILGDFNRQLAIKPVDHNLANFILTPLLIIFSPENYDGRLGFAVITLPLLLTLIRPIPYGIKVLGGISFLYYVIWFFGFTFARFLLPLLAALGLMGSYMLGRLVSGNSLPKAITYIVLIAALLLPLPGLLRDLTPRVKGVLKGTPKYEFLINYNALDPYKTQSGTTFKPFTYISAWRYLNENTPPDTKVGILASFTIRADGYYLERDYYYLNPSEQVEYNFAKLREASRIKSAVADMGLDYIVIDKAVRLQFYAGSPWSKYPNFDLFSDGVNALESYCSGQCQIAYQDSNYIIYKL